MVCQDEPGEAKSFGDVLSTTPAMLLAAVVAWLAFGVFSTAQDKVGNATGLGPAGINYGPIHFEGYANYIYRDNLTAAQVVLSDTTSESPVRFITAFPNGNSGALVYLLPVEGELGATLNASTLTSMRDERDNQTGVTGHFSLSGDAEFGVTIIGSVRTLRDYVESKGKVMHEMFNYTLGGYSSSEVWLVRNYLNGSTVQYLGFKSVDNCNVEVKPSDSITLPPSIRITRQDKAKNATVYFESTGNFTGTTPPTPFVPLQGLGMDMLFAQNATANTADVVKAIRGNASDIVEQMAFLSYESEFLAGGWRFLTYFGRDTLFTLELLMPVLTPEAAEAVLAAVIQRTNESGELCHEETVGDYASFLNIQDGHPERGNTPVYDYKMLDTDFLLLPVLADYAARHPSRTSAFMGRNSTFNPGTFAELLQRNVDRVLKHAQPFAQDPKKENLLAIRDAHVGNWRDSNAGLGWGTIPYDVNCAFVPAALRGIAALAKLGHLSQNGTAMNTMAHTWDQACDMFAVQVSPSDAEARLQAYVSAANLSTSLLYGAGSLNDSQTVNTDKGYAWSEPVQTVGGSTSNSSTLFAVSLLPSLAPIEIQHSDLGFTLLLSPNISTAQIQATVEALQPYPRGLLTNVGMLVANAAYSPNTSHTEEFGNTAYHGAVAWSWQQALMAAGVQRQLELCARVNVSIGPSGLEPTIPTKPGSTGPTAPIPQKSFPAWCTTHQSALEQAQTRLWDSIYGSRDVLWTEVWSAVFANGTFGIGDLGRMSADGTEGDAVQLWSYAFLGLTDPRNGLPVAGGMRGPGGG